MTEAPTARPRTVPQGDPADNAVTLRARVSAAPVDRELPSGAVISTFRLSVQRGRTAMTSGSAQTVDWVDCSAWTARTRRSVASWQVGDEVEVTGSLRRRFYRSGDGAATRLEVEVLSARRACPRDGSPDAGDGPAAAADGSAGSGPAADGLTG